MSAFRSYWNTRARPWLRYLTTFTRRDLSTRYAWVEWILPFQIVNIVVGLATWFFFANAVGGRATALYEEYGSSIASYLVVGMACSGLLRHSLAGFHRASMMAAHGSYGIQGQNIGMLDYVYLSGVPASAFLGGFVIWGYIENLIIVGVYLLAGYVLFGFRIPAGADIPCAVLILVLGMLATSGLGLISASTVWITRS